MDQFNELVCLGVVGGGVPAIIGSAIVIRWNMQTNCSCTCPLTIAVALRPSGALDRKIRKLLQVFRFWFNLRYKKLDSYFLTYVDTIMIRMHHGAIADPTAGSSVTPTIDTVGA